MNTRHSAVLSLDARFVKRALGLPENCRIRAARGNDRVVEFHVEHRDLPETPEGDPVPVLAPLIEFSRGDWPKLLSWNGEYPMGRCFLNPSRIRIGV